MRSFVLLAALVALLATAGLAEAACKKGKKGCLQCKNNRCIKCKPYTSSENEDGDIFTTPAWALKKDGTCVQCKPQGNYLARSQCMECNPNKPSMCTKCLERDDVDQPLYLNKKAVCAVCPGFTKGCAGCASISGRCLECYDSKNFKPSGTKCVKKGQRVL